MFLKFLFYSEKEKLLCQNLSQIIKKPFKFFPNDFRKSFQA